MATGITVSDHQRIDRQVAALHLVIARRIRSGDKGPVDRARSNLQRWQLRFGGDLPPAYAQWLAILDQGEDAVLAILEGQDQHAVRVRSSSPFAGVLSPPERWEILRHAS